MAIIKKPIDKEWYNGTMEDLGDVYTMHEGVRVYALDSVSKHLPIKKSYRKNKIIKGVEVMGIQFEI